MHVVICPNHFWTQEMCNEVMCTMTDAFQRIPDRFKTEEMCDKAVKKNHYSLQFVPDWFVIQQHIESWGDDDYDGDHWEDDEDGDSF